MKILEDLFITRPAKYWLDELERVGVPAGPINDFKQVFDDEQVRHRGMEVKVKHPLRDELSLIRNALTFSETPIKDYRAPPLLGQNTDEVLKGKLGYNEAKLAELRKGGIIQQAG
jgi:crotonobetainyl-CoA:carnitine CoA-transferase CaiB-like acyl-CoA transferase